MLHGQDFRGRHQGGLARFPWRSPRPAWRRWFCRCQRRPATGDSSARVFPDPRDFRKHLFLRAGRLEREDSLQSLSHPVLAHAKWNRIFLPRLSVPGQAELVQENSSKIRRCCRANGIDSVRPAIFCRGKCVCIRASRRVRKLQPLSNFLGRHQQCVVPGFATWCKSSPADLPGTKRSDGFVNGHDSTHFGGVHFFAVQDFDRRIHHFSASGAQLVDFHLAVKD